MTKLICITGLDGVGKSTVINRLADHFTSCYVADIWDLLHSPIQSLPFKSKSDIDHFLCSLTHDSRLFFLAHALKYSIDKALESQNEIVIADSYYYKYLATEKALGANHQLIKALIRSFPKPDLVIELVLPVEICADRKTKYSRYECGLAEKPAQNDYINFQRKAAQQWKDYKHENWTQIDATQTPDAVFNQCMEIILK